MSSTRPTDGPDDGRIQQVEPDIQEMNTLRNDIQAIAIATVTQTDVTHFNGAGTNVEYRSGRVAAGTNAQYKSHNHERLETDYEEEEENGTVDPGASKRIRIRNQMRRRTVSVTLSEGVDEGKTLKEHAGYHQAITGRQAEQRLRKCGGHCYLTRYSEIKRCYVLSVYEPQRHSRPLIYNFKIVVEDDGEHRIQGKRAVFNDIQSLLEHYEHNRIDPALRSIGRAYTENEYEHSSNCTIL